MYGVLFESLVGEISDTRQRQDGQRAVYTTDSAMYFYMDKFFNLGYGLFKKI